MSAEIISKATALKMRRRALASYAEVELARLINTLSKKEGAVTRVHRNISYSWSASRAVLVKLRRGHSCNKHWYMHFLETNFRHFVEDGRGEDIASESHSNDASVAKKSIVIDIVIEQGHGTKVLDSGIVRLDAGLSKSATEEFLSSQFKTIFNYTVRSIRTRKELAMLQDKVMSRFEFSSLSAGVGITEEMMSTCLTTLVDVPKSRLKELSGTLTMVLNIPSATLSLG